MKFWLPYTRGGSGADVSTQFLAQGLIQAGHEAVCQDFPHNLQYFPWPLKAVTPPPKTDAIITNTWNGFIFHRPSTVNITVERLFVPDPAYRPYKSLPQDIFHQTLVRHFVRRSMLTADACTAVSEYTANAAHQCLKLPAPQVILNAVDTDFFSPAPRDDERCERKPNDPFRLLFVGNFTHRKGADLMSEIMRRLGPGFQLEFTSGIRTNNRQRYPDNMHCLDKQSLDGVRAAYRRAHALLFPSRLEGLPRTVMESLACGTPVIAADTSSLPEAVDHLGTGLLCPVNDIDAFAAAARRLAMDAKLWSGMATAARQTAVERFCLERMVQEYIALAARLLADKGHRRADAVARLR